MDFVMRFSFFAVVTVLAAIFAPEKLRQPGGANKLAIGAWFVLAGMIFLP